MKVPYSWLQEYVDFDLSPEELAKKLTMAGLEVDRVEHRWQHIVTARISWKEAIKGSDHLNATRVSTPTSERELSVVCGAPNISAGDVVPLALPGAEFEGSDGQTLTIGVSQKRGVLSEGMLCSPRELGLSNDHEGIYLLPNDTPLGVSLAEDIIDLDIKAHRGDLFSIVGVAREVAAFSNTRLKRISVKPKEIGKKKIAAYAKLTIEAKDLCPRFMVRVIRNVQIGPSPLWLVRRLAAAGVRSISNVVDITNYVMLELGQPLHAFDYDKVADHHIIVRRAAAGEKLQTLDGQDRTLTSDMVLVCDAQGPLSIAGVMGGASSEVSATTTHILLEAATWMPGNIRRTSSQLGLRSEASSRYEKGVDPELVHQGLDRAAQLMSELACGEVVPGCLDVYSQRATQRTIEYSARDCEWLLGYTVTSDEAKSALQALEFGVESVPDSDTLLVSIPTWRGDVVESADLVEEVARVLGYDRITGTLPTGTLPDPQTENWFDRLETVRNSVAGAGYHEIVTYPLTNRATMLNLLTDHHDVTPLLVGAVDELEQMPAHIQRGEKAAMTPLGIALPPLLPEQLPAIVIVNPLSTRQELLRLTLQANVLEVAAANIKQGMQSVNCFEVGLRYINLPVGTSLLPQERKTLAIVSTGRKDDDWIDHGRDVDFFDLKATLEMLFTQWHIAGVHFTQTHHPTFHPGRCALIEIAIEHNGVQARHPVGIMGEIHPVVAQRFEIEQRIFIAEIDLERLYIGHRKPHFAAISRYPALIRDLAIIVDTTVSSEALTAVIRDIGGDVVRSVTLFDVYTGPSIPAGKQSLAFTITYQSDDRTLGDEEGDAQRKRVAEVLFERFGAVIRES